MTSNSSYTKSQHRQEFLVVPQAHSLSDGSFKTLPVPPHIVRVKQYSTGIGGGGIKIWGEGALNLKCVLVK